MSKNKDEEQYNISTDTMAIVSNEEDIGNNTTYIIEEDSDCIVYEKPLKIIEHSCKYFGSSLEGRLEGTRDISNFTHKPPIAIDPTSGIYFFPTASPTSKRCSWLSHSHIEDIIATEDDCTEVIFFNGERLKFDISFHSMRSQIYRTAHFRFSLEMRMKDGTPFKRNDRIDRYLF